MPSKGTYFIAFLVVMLVSTSLHYFVWRQLRRLLRKDFGEKARIPMRFATALFLLMEIPFFFLMFRRQITVDIPTISQLILYPFTAWQILMLLWAVILVPQVIYRGLRKLVALLRTSDKGALTEETRLDKDWDQLNYDGAHD